MSLAATIIVIVALVVILFAGLALVMSRPRGLRPHRPGWRGGLSSRRERARREPAAAPADPTAHGPRADSPAG